MATTVDTPRDIDVHFPLAGIDLSEGFWKQRARQLAEGIYGRTTPVGQNVCGFPNDRARGGSRPGLAKYIPAAPVDEWILQCMATVAYTSQDAAR